MAKIVDDAARKLGEKPYQVFVNAYAAIGHTETIARPHWDEYRAMNIVPDIVESYCLNVLTGRAVAQGGLRA